MTLTGELYLTSHSPTPKLVSMTYKMREFVGGVWQDAVNPDLGPTQPVPQVFGPPPNPNHWDGFACDSWNNGLVDHYRVYHLVYTVAISDVTFPPPGGGDCPQSPFTIPNPPPFPPGAPTVKSVFKLRSPISLGGGRPPTSSRVELEFDRDRGNVILQDDRDTPGKLFTFSPDLNGRTYQIYPTNGPLLYQSQDSGGDLGGIFAGQDVTPPGCLFRLGKKAWILEPVPGAPVGVFFIRNQATGDRLQINFPGSSIGDRPTLINPRGNLPEQWELLPISR
jgi:hypothetical protein